MAMSKCGATSLNLSIILFDLRVWRVIIALIFSASPYSVYRCINFIKSSLFRILKSKLNRFRISSSHLGVNIEGHTIKTLDNSPTLADISVIIIPASMVFPNPTSSASKSLCLNVFRNLRIGLNWWT